MRPLLLALCFASIVAAGCSSDDEPDARKDQPTPAPRFTEERVVREWITALNGGDVDKAARYFAKNAVVDQGRPIKLPNAAAARFFNASLPCRADLTEVEDEPGPRALASFELRKGPGGPCEGTVQVRVTVEDGRFTKWRQLPEPSGPVV